MGKRSYAPMYPRYIYCTDITFCAILAEEINVGGVYKNEFYLKIIALDSTVKCT